VEVESKVHAGDPLLSSRQKFPILSLLNLAFVMSIWMELAYHDHAIGIMSLQIITNTHNVDAKLI